MRYLSFLHRFLCFVILLPLLFAGCQPAAPKVEKVIYDDVVASDWEDWSWETTANLFSTSNTHNGDQAIEAYFNGWGGFSLRSSTPIDPTEYTAITFWVFAPDGEQPLLVFTQEADDGAESMKVTVTAGPEWQGVTVSLADFGSPAVIKRINIQEGTGTPVSVVFIDDLKLVGK